MLLRERRPVARVVREVILAMKRLTAVRVRRGRIQGKVLRPVQRVILDIIQGKERRAAVRVKRVMPVLVD